MGHIRGIDSAANEIALRLAERLHTSPEDAVAQALAAYEANLNRLQRNPDAPAWLRKLWHDYPLPPPTGFPADKAFFDDLSGDL